MIIAKWEPQDRKNVARIFCRNCQAVKVIDMYKNIHWWAAAREKPLRTEPCDKCRIPMSWRITEEGVEQL